MTLLNCPDVMSNVIEEPLLSKWEILSFAQKHGTYNINLWNGQHFQYGRSEIKTSCEKYPDLGLSPTCIEVSYDIIPSYFIHFKIYTSPLQVKISSSCFF